MALKPTIKVWTLKMSPGDQALHPHRPLAMTDSQLRMVALLQGQALAAAGRERCRGGAGGLAVAALVEARAGLAPSQQGGQRQEGDDVQELWGWGRASALGPPCFGGETPAPHPPSPRHLRADTGRQPRPAPPHHPVGCCGVAGAARRGCGEVMAPGQASPPPSLVHSTATPAASASGRRGVPEHGDSWGVQRRQRGAVEGGRRGPGPGPGAARPRGRPHRSHGEAGPGCNRGPPPSHVVLAGRGREGCQSPPLRCCCL